MKKFRNIRTGIVEVVTNKKLIEQYEKHNDVYVEVGTSSKEPTFNELKKQAKEMGIKYDTNVTKAELSELIANAE